MIRFIDVQRQKTWVRQIELTIESVGEPEESKYGLCQVVQAIDGVGRTEPLNYFFEDLQGSIDPLEVGVQWYDIKWHTDGYFKCKPAEAKPKDLESESPNWDEINLGKCRHGILCAYIQYNGINITQAVLDSVNELAHFSMTGEIE